MTQAESLYTLQEIDLAMLRAQKRLSEIATALGDNKAVVEAQGRASAAQAALVPLRNKARNLEWEIQANTQKAQASEQQLYSGRVKNPKQLQDLEQEIKSLKKHKAELEDTLLNTMVAVDEAEAAIELAESDLKRVTQTWEDSHKHLVAEQADLQAQVLDLRRRRAALLPELAPDSLKLYDSLKLKKNHQPVSPLSESSCTVCGVEQTLAVEREVQRGSALVMCANCGRILVYKD